MKTNHILIIIVGIMLLVCVCRTSMEYFTDEEKAKVLEEAKKFLESTGDLSEEPFAIAGMLDTYIEEKDLDSIIEASGNNDKDTVSGILKKYT